MEYNAICSLAKNIIFYTYKLLPSKFYSLSHPQKKVVAKRKYLNKFFKYFSERRKNEGVIRACT
jgi:hypothetical protein